MCKCRRTAKLCPFSFGLGLGLTSALAIFLWSLWIIYVGPTPAMDELHITAPTVFADGAILAAWALLKGFIFGFFIALFYDLVSWCCSCCRRSKCCDIAANQGTCKCCGSNACNCNCSK